MIQATNVIAMAMGHHHEVQLSEINPFGFHVMGKDFGVVAGVEQDALATHFHQRGEAPIFLH